MAIIDDVSQFFMFIVTITTCLVLAIILPSIEPIIARIEEPKPLGGTPEFWTTLYIIIVFWMLYAWGYKPLAALYKSDRFQGRFLSALGTIFRAAAMWGVLLGIAFMACGVFLELFEGLALISNIMSVVLLLAMWFLIEYKRHVTVAKAFNAPILKPHPMREILKSFKKD